MFRTKNLESSRFLDRLRKAALCSGSRLAMMPVRKLNICRVVLRGIPMLEKYRNTQSRFCVRLVSARLSLPAGDGCVCMYTVDVDVGVEEHALFHSHQCHCHQALSWVCQTIACFHGQKQDKNRVLFWAATLTERVQLVDKADAWSETWHFFASITDSRRLSVSLSHHRNENRLVSLFLLKQNMHWVENKTIKHPTLKREVYQVITWLFYC